MNTKKVILPLCEKVLFTHIRLDDAALCAKFDCYNGQEWYVDGVQFHFHPFINAQVFETFIIKVPNKEEYRFPFDGDSSIHTDNPITVFSGPGELRLIAKHPNVFESIRPTFESIQVLGWCQIFGRKEVTP